MSDVTLHSEKFRDSLSIMDAEGKRKWVYPKFQTGSIFIRRNIVAYFFLALLIIMPFIKWNGHPFMLFNVIDRQFIVWGIPFFPQDFFLFGFGMLTFIIFIILFTSIWGRWWCGWACPQTIFMEFIFRRIEYFIEGDAQQRRILDKASWSRTKIMKKGFKYLIFFLISFFISNIFLAYIIGIDELKKIITEPVIQHPGGFAAIMIFSVVFYGVFAGLREQVCIGVCPYGRLQSVLLDKDSMAAAYDYKRGEPRGKMGTTEGDCIDCHLCVQVCPTGIDIRNGMQMECINCTACIDACNSIMKKVERPNGLIRIASISQIEKKTKKIHITGRMIAYAALWVVMVCILAYMVFTRTDVQATVLRAPGQLFQKKNDTTITNLYTISLVNKSFEDHPIELKISNTPEATLIVVGNPLFVKQDETANGAFFIALPTREIHSMKTPLSIDVISGGKKIDQLSTAFIGPVYKHHDDKKDESLKNHSE